MGNEKNKNEKENQQEKNNFLEKEQETHEINAARKRKMLKRKITYICLFSVIALAFVYLCYMYLFKITTLEIVGNSYYSAEEIEETFGIHVGDRILEYSRGKKEKLLLDKYPYIAECKIERSLPEKVTITVKERTAAMYTFTSGKYVVFDEDSIVLEISDTPRNDLMLVEFNENVITKCIPGEQMLYKDENTCVGLERVYNSVMNSEIQSKVKSIKVESRFDYYLQYGERFTVYLGDSKDCDAKILFFCGILTKLYEEDKGIIDVSKLKEGSFIRK